MNKIQFFYEEYENKDATSKDLFPLHFDWLSVKWKLRNQ